VADKPTQRPMTWLEVAVRNGGFRKALKALVWAQTWATVREAIGHDPTVDEVADWWKAPRRSAFRDQAAFRECFPSLDSPAPIFAAPELREKMRQAAKASDDLDDLVRAMKQRKRPNDASILQLGLGRATV